MQRRGVTVLLGAIVVMVLAVGVLAAPVPYVALQPGPTWDTLGEHEGEPVIVLEGAEPTGSAGELHLTTVAVQADLSLLEALRAWLDDEDAVVPEELVYPPEQTREEVEQRNAEQFSRSQNVAEAAALRQLGYPTRVAVVGVADDSPAAGQLRAGDVITSVDGEPVSEASQLQQLVTADPVGTTLTIGYLRDGEPDTAEVTTAALGDDDTPRIGVEITHEFDAPFELEIRLEQIGGPSAGLMFALGIIDTLEPEDLTGGEIIAGTGSIDELGNVGPIGGVPQKLVAADQLGATTFLVPAGNCAEARASAPSALRLVRVETLAGALDALADLRADRAPPAC